MQEELNAKTTFIEAFNSEVWKTKSEQGISLKSEIEGIEIPKHLKHSEVRLLACITYSDSSKTNVVCLESKNSSCPNRNPIKRIFLLDVHFLQTDDALVARTPQYHPLQQVLTDHVYVFQSQCSGF